MSSSHGFADLDLSVCLANRIEASLKNLSPDRFEYFVKQVGFGVGNSFCSKSNVRMHVSIVLK